MNKTAVHVTIIAAGLFAASCNNNKTTTTSESTTDTAMLVDNGNKMVRDSPNVAERVVNAMNGNQDSNFVVKATVGNNEDVMMLQAGIKDGTDKMLVAHAKMMLEDHKKLGTAIKEFSSKKGYQLPTGDNGNANELLTSLAKDNKGADWDKDWVKKMAERHETDLNLFEKAEKEVKDPELKNMASGTLPTLNAHIEMLNDLKNTMKK